MRLTCKDCFLMVLPCEEPFSDDFGFEVFSIICNITFNISKDFTKPLPLSSRFSGNISTDELVVVVSVSLVPSIVPVPITPLGFVTSAIPALILATLATSYRRESMEGHH